MVRPSVLYNTRALQIAAALDSKAEHLDRPISFDRLSVVAAPSAAPTWVWDKDFQGAECARLRRNREVVIRTLALNGDAGKNARGEAMKHIDPQYLMNRDFLASAVMVNGLALKHAPEEYKADRPLAISAVRQNGMALEYVCDALKNDVEVCCYAVAQTERAMVHVGPLQRDCYEVLLASDKTGALRDDRKWMMKALREEPHLLMYASKRLSMDPDVVAMACQQDGLCLAYASKTLKADMRIVRTAVEQNGLALEYAGTSMQGSINVMGIAVRQNGLALEFASDHLKADKRAVLRALQFNGLALQFASESMRRDKGVVIRALKENPQAWKYAHRSLRKDPEFSPKRLQKLLELDFELQDPGEQDEPDQAAESNANRRTMCVPGDLPIRMPAHPPNGALVPTWMLSMSSSSPSSAVQSSGGGGSSLGGTLRSTGSPTWGASQATPKLPSVQRSNSSPALQRTRSPVDL